LESIAIIVPVLNDWGQIERLIRELHLLPALSGRQLHMLIVDDGSFPAMDASSLAPAFSGSGSVIGATSVRLACNMGHQRAIAAGLVEVSQRSGLRRVIVMDADGEDRPEDVAALIAASDTAGEAIILALRARRSETRAFRLGYRVYRVLFRLLTGNSIRFGNFCLIPFKHLEALTHNPATWNNLAAAIMRSRLPLVAVPTTRGERYGGESKMNFVSLAVHGLSAISVYADVTLVRIICAALSVSGVIAIALLAVIGLKLFTGVAIPGWASFMAVLLLVLLFQALVFATIALFQLLSFRSMPAVVPVTYVPQYVAEVNEAPSRTLAE
jgi:hypothetical protein